MSKSIKLAAMFGFIVVAAACARESEEVIIVDPEPISTEPVHTGKFK